MWRGRVDVSIKRVTHSSETFLIKISQDGEEVSHTSKMLTKICQLGEIEI